MIRFFPTYDFVGLARGKLDDELKRFAISIIQFGKPIFFVPWPMVNRVYSPKGTIYSKDRTDPVAVKAAWTHLHEIFKSAGANQYAVWGLHVLPLGSQQSLNAFKLDPNQFDWVGFAMYTLKDWGQENFLLNLTDAYEWAELNYPGKPVAIFEMGRVDTDGQGRWITNAYKIIKRFPRIKMAIYSEYESAGFGRSCGGTLISEKAKAKYKEAVADPYFIKGGRQVKEILDFWQ